MSNFLVTIRGIPDNPGVTEITIRSGPGTTFESLGKIKVGTNNLPVLEAAPDPEGKGFQGKTYQWLKLQLPDNRQVWARDDLLNFQGDGTAFGYGVYDKPTFAFSVARSAVAVPAAPVPAAPVPAAPAPAPAPVAAAPAPVAPAPVPTAPTPAQPVPPSAQPSTPPAIGVCHAVVMMRDGANGRPGPGTNFTPATKMPRGTRFEVLEVTKPVGDTFQWVRGSINGTTYWMREDVLRYEGDSKKWNLGENDLYPSPMNDRWWVRGFTGQNISAGDHTGWDFGAATGEKILVGPKGGFVTASVECTKCAGGKSFKHFNIPLGDGAALSDPAWNFGYGHYVIVRYDHANLPASTQAWLASKGLAGAHAFAMYAHLDQRVGQVGQTLKPGDVVGTCGDTGNSELTHLHLELRFSTNPNEQWANMKKNLFDPVVLFGK
jgi:hypothetical protein